jgi:hypothetical protein
MEHDPRCEGLNDEKLLADVAEYGWHVNEDSKSARTAELLKTIE